MPRSWRDTSVVSAGFLLQFGGSVIAVGMLGALAAWAGIARTTSRLEPASAREHFAAEFPDHRPSAVWVADDGRSAIADAGSTALLLVQIGDGYVAREVPWGKLAQARRAKDGSVLVFLDDAGAPRLKLGAGSWPAGVAAA